MKKQPLSKTTINLAGIVLGLVILYAGISRAHKETKTTDFPNTQVTTTTVNTNTYAGERNPDATETCDGSCGGTCDGGRGCGGGYGSR